MRTPRKAFTLIEMLVVIGIILVLLGIVVMGFRHVEAVGASRATAANLKVCQGLLTEYHTQNGWKYIEEQAYPGVTPPPPVYVDPVPLGPNNPGARPAIQFSDYGTASSNPPYVGPMDTGTLRYTSNAVVNTQRVMSYLARVPQNRTVIGNLPTKSLLESQNGAPADIAKGVVVLDGWNNPIILVPAGGIHVYIKDPSATPDTYNDYIVRSTGTYPAASAPPVSANDHPFFASAGQDGDFTKGEDNVYSFGQ